MELTTTARRIEIPFITMVRKGGNNSTCTDNCITMCFIVIMLLLFTGGAIAGAISHIAPVETIGKVLFYSLLVLWMIFKTDLGFKICYPKDINDPRCKQEDLDTLYFRFILLSITIFATVCTLTYISSVITMNEIAFWCFIALIIPLSLLDPIFSINYVVAFKEYGFAIIGAIVSIIIINMVYKNIISTRIEFERMKQYNQSVHIDYCEEE